MHVARTDAHERTAWVVAGARSGAGGSVLVVGEPGAGKSTVLEQALGRAGDAAVLRATGVPVEQGMPHSGLHAVLRPLTDLLPLLPEVQRSALEVVLGLAAGPAPTPFLVGAAVLSLLAAKAEQQAVVVAVDDAQWVDEASVHALAFAARRLAGERVGILLAARAAQVPDALAGLPRCDLPPLTAEQAAQALELAPEVAAALVEALGGNLLALAERVRALSPDQRAGRAPLPATAAGPVFAARAAALPEQARDAAVLAALEAPPAVLARARAALALPADALLPAEAAGLLAAGPEGVRWRHPLAREAVLEAAGPARTRALAAALAAAAVEEGAPEGVVVELRLAAADAPDEDLAQALDRLGRDADASGDHGRAARLWERAAQVGTDAQRRPLRLLEAAEATFRAGRLRTARSRYEAALAAGGSARAHLALGRIEHTAGSPRRALEQFAAAAEAAATSPLRVRACAEGVLAAMYAADPAAARRLAEQAHAAHDPASARDRLLALHARGAAAALSGDPAAARPLLTAAVQEAPAVLPEEPDLVLWVVSAGLFPGGPGDDVQAVAGPALERLRLRGDLTWLPRVVRLSGLRHELAGRWLTAYASYEEAVELSRAAEQTTQLVEALHALAQLEALRGERAPCLEHTAEAEQLLRELDVPFLAGLAWCSRGLLHLGLGEAAAAAAALAPAVALPDSVPWRQEAVADLVEALVLDGRPQEAARAAEAAPGPRAAGVLHPDDAAAVELLLQAAQEEEDDPLGQARCRLLAGSRLRRSGRRREAREQLRAAAEVFDRAGAQPWRQRAEEELAASGETLLRGDEHRDALTGAELRVAALVAEGRPTREVAALLFLSPKTVEFHLSRIYRKLGVRGRAELAHRLATA